jgi:hypothetical protein
VDEAVGGEDYRAAEFVRLAVKIGDFSSGFFDEEDAGGDVPFVQAKFPQPVEASGGDGREIERGGAIAADSVGALREFSIEIEILAGLTVALREAGAEKTRGDGRNARNREFGAVKRCAFTTSGGEKFVVKRIEDDSGEKSSAMFESDGNGEAGIAMSEIGGAVERVHVPAKIGSVVAASSLFGDDGVIGKIVSEARDDELLGAAVGLSDEVDFIALVADLGRAGKFFDEDLAGFLSDFDGSGEIRLLHGIHFRGIARGTRAGRKRKWPLGYTRDRRGGRTMSEVRKKRSGAAGAFSGCKVEKRRFATTVNGLRIGGRPCGRQRAGKLSEAESGLKEAVVNNNTPHPPVFWMCGKQRS